MSKELKQIGDDILASLNHLGPQKIDISLGTSTWLETVPKLDNVVASDYFFHLSENILGNPSLLLGKSEFIAPYSSEATNLAKEGQEQLEQPKKAKLKGIKSNRVGSFGELAQRLLRDKNNHPKENGFLDSGNDFSDFPLDEHVLNHANEVGESNKSQPINLGNKKEVSAENIIQENKRELIEPNKETDLVPSTNNVVEINRFPKENGLDKNGESVALLKPNSKKDRTDSIGSFTKFASSLLEHEREVKTLGVDPKEIGQKNLDKKSEETIGLSEQKGSGANHQITKQQHSIIEGNFKGSPEEPNQKNTALADLNTNAINHLVTILKDVANKPDCAESLELVKVMTQLLNSKGKPSRQIPGEVVAVSQYKEPALGEKELFEIKENNSIIPFLKSSKITAQIDHSAFKKSKELKLSYRRFYGE